MDHTLRYRSTRAEIWRWYWRAWRARLWKIHVLVAGVAAFICAATFPGQVTLTHYLVSFGVTFPIVVLFLSLWPQIMFKSKERVLIVGHQGWSTQIGKQSGSRSWAQVATVQTTPNSIVLVGITGNALIIPSRAFTDSASRTQFFQDVQGWHRAAHV
jgi:hypothetical protein